MLEAFLETADCILIGGGMAFPFIKYLGGEIANSLCKQEELLIVDKFFKKSKQSRTKIILPIDVIATESISAPQNHIICEANKIPKNFMGVDIGPATIQLFSGTKKNGVTVAKQRLSEIFGY